MSTIGTIHNGGITLGATYISPLTITSSGAVETTTGDGIVGNAAGDTVFNDGTVQGGNHAIIFTAGGYINNGTGGFNTALITGGLYGVYISGAAGTVTNSGTIFGSANGVNLEKGGIVTNTGYIHSTGGSVFINTVASTVTNSGTIAGSNGVVLQAGGTVIDSGTISGSGGTAVGFGAGGSVLALENGYKLIGAVSVTGSNKLELLGATGAVTVNFDKVGAGFTNFTTAAFGPTSGNNEILQITNTASLPGTISGFNTSHEIVDLTQFTNPGAAVVNFNSVTNQLTVTEGAQSVTLQLDSENYTGVSWTPGPDTGTDITAMCFCRGTLIRTPDGEVPVEELAIGDKVVTLSGAARRIKWIGRRAYDGRFVAGNRDVLPIRIAVGALADGVPARDLWVSPEHALHIDGALAPAKHLINGATITQAEDVEQVEYFHVELDTHDVIFAEGAPAETYVDCDNRFMFHNAGEFARLYPDEPLPVWQSSLCGWRTARPSWLLSGRGSPGVPGFPRQPRRRRRPAPTICPTRPWQAPQSASWGKVAPCRPAGTSTAPPIWAMPWSATARKTASIMSTCAFSARRAQRPMPTRFSLPAGTRCGPASGNAGPLPPTSSCVMARWRMCGGSRSAPTSTTRRDNIRRGFARLPSRRCKSLSAGGGLPGRARSPTATRPICNRCCRSTQRPAIR